jgi:protein-tyrosine-phosphatase
MAEAFAKKYGLEASSAGTHPLGRIYPAVRDVMEEKEIALSPSKKLTTAMIDEADRVVAIGPSVLKSCPKRMLRRMNKKRIEWTIRDPKGRTTAEVRKIRDETERKARDLATQTTLFETARNA